MQLNISTFSRFIEQNSRQNLIKNWVIFGQDQGHVIISKNKIIKAFYDSWNINTYNYKEAKEDYGSIIQLLSSSDIFGNKNLVIIEEYPDSCNKEIEEILTNNNYQGSIIIIADELKKSNKFRKTLENKQNICFLNCYKESNYEISEYIKSYLDIKNIEYEDKVPLFLSENLINDRLIINNELEKISLFIKPFDNENKTQKLTLEKASSIINQESSIYLDKLCFYFINLEKENFLLLLEKSISEKTSIIMIIRILQNYIYKIINIKIKTNKEIQINKKANIIDIIENIKPPIYAETKSDILKLSKKIQIKRLREMLFFLMEIEIKIKSINTLDQSLLFSIKTTEYILKYV